ncbi:MAG: hypothetical protein AB7H90_09320 [Alphaproteobacteria bacterium]
MDKQMIELLARRAGLDKALAQFPDDVAAAAAQANGITARIKAPTDPAAEPWPPMRVGPCPLPYSPAATGNAGTGGGR